MKKLLHPGNSIKVRHVGYMLSLKFFNHMAAILIVCFSFVEKECASS